jgi:hypothetical protein
MHEDGIQKGSGYDLANAYMQKATQGLPRKTDLKLADLVYCSVGAYVAATQNSGVGGEPTISITDKNGVKFIDEARCRLLANLLGKVEAEATTKAETYPLVTELVEDYLEGKPLTAFLKKHNIPEELTKVAYTIGQWMAITNREVLAK